MNHEDADGKAVEATLISQCRELLGEDAEGMSDQDIDYVRRHAETMAHVLVEVFLQREITE